MTLMKKKKMIFIINYLFEEQIEKISRFTSAIWAGYPFVEGNTRQTAIF